MPSATETVEKRGGESGKLLKGSDLGKSENSITVFINRVREAPAGWGSPLVCDIAEAHGCTALALNKTNIKRLSDLIDDDYDMWAGYEVTFARVRVTNPRTNGAAYGLEVDTVKKSKRKVPKKSDVPF